MVGMAQTVTRAAALAVLASGVLGGLHVDYRRAA
jgi:hypothetical protein